ncbi:precorrin-6y C5,15-methyltransferase (decarboxylating) subunit CbiE, partial [bacterium]
VLLSVHGRDPDKVVAAVKANGKVVLLTDPRKSPEDLARRFQAAGIDKKIYLCENLSYPDEKITELTVEELGRISGFNNSVMVMTDE